MTAKRHFSKDYAEARGRFLAAGGEAGTAIESHAAPAPGPEGETLFADVAWLGPTEAERVLVTISATHGAEGFCGSGVQCGWLETGLHRQLPPGIALLQIHAINPYGFAWLRRVTEDNVDLNRNFVDHGAPYPVNAGYEELKAAICPPEWNDAVIAETAAVFEAYAEAKGPRALQKAISGGQYGHPQGIFYGGDRPTWSHRLLSGIFRQRLAAARHVAVIDYHTGLGPYGHGERICIHDPDSQGLARARDWFGDDVTSPALGDSASVEIFGFNVMGMEDALPERTALTAVALEYGTIPSPEVRLALRADNWLHAHGRPDSRRGRAIKEQIRAAFYPDRDDWKEMVWERALESQRQALTGLRDT
jgi:hypothetical protein